MVRSRSRVARSLLLFSVVLGGCGAAEGDSANPDVLEEHCDAAIDEASDFAQHIGCKDNFEALASDPVDVSVPGARSMKFVLDQLDGDALYFQNSTKYQIHWDFASKFLSTANGKPPVGMLADFNQTEYYSPERRFLLGALTHYEGPDVWALEFSPYDTASAAMMEKAYLAIKAQTYFGKKLFFHPTSEAVAKEAAKLPESVPIKTTDQLFEQIQFQPLNLGSSVGRLRFLTVEQLETECVSFRDIVVLDHVPNDLSVTLGIVTQEFQTPLSHINVLARNRKIPNMWLRDAFSNTRLRAHEGQWVSLTVRGGDFTIEQQSEADADAWWDEHRPAKLTIPDMDLSKTGLVDLTTIIDPKQALRGELKSAILAFGGKATHYAAMAGAEIVPMPEPRGFGIPVYYYDQFMTQNGFYEKVDALLSDKTFTGGDCQEQGARLKALRKEMEEAPVDAEFTKLLDDKLRAEYGSTPIRYRSSSTAEDVGGFTGAGLYTSKTGVLDSVEQPPLRAIKKVWSSVWYQRGFQERDYRQVDQKAVGMAILAHPAFKHETASGVAQTANSYDPSGLNPAFVINVQLNDGSVTLPEEGQTTDQLVYYYFSPNQPLQYIQHSNQVPAGESVLTPDQIHDLGKSLDAIHKFFMPAYGPPDSDPFAWYALEVDFKFDQPPGADAPILKIKQARPLPSPFGK
jgi:pyruvate, water dikinase